jgi:hypothetical protein
MAFKAATTSLRRMLRLLLVAMSARRLTVRAIQKIAAPTTSDDLINLSRSAGALLIPDDLADGEGFEHFGDEFAAGNHVPLAFLRTGLQTNSR